MEIKSKQKKKEEKKKPDPNISLKKNEYANHNIN